MSSRAVMHFCSPHEKHSSPWDVRLAIFWALLSPAQLPQVSCLSMGQNFVFKNCWMEQNIIKQNKVVKVAGCHCTRHNAIATIATYTVDQQLQNIVEGMLKHILCEQPWNQSQTNNQIWLQNWLLCTVGHWWYAQWHGKKTNNILTSKLFFLCLLAFFLPVYQNVCLHILNLFWANILHAIIWLIHHYTKHNKIYITSY